MKPEPTQVEVRSAWIKSVVFGVFVFALLAAFVLPTVWDKSPPRLRGSNVVGITFQLMLTAFCVGGWFGAFLFFNKFWGDEEEH